MKRAASLSIAFLAVFLQFIAGSLAQAAICVDAQNGSDANTGTGWSSARLTVQEAINDAYAAGGGEVWVKAGVYYPTSAITMKPGVRLYGRFTGSETSLAGRVLPSMDDRTLESQESVLDGTNASDSVVIAANTAMTDPATTVIDGFTIRNGIGHLYSSDSSRLGGQVVIGAACVTLSNNIMEGGSAVTLGGVAYVDGGSMVTGNHIVGGLSTTYGGGLVCVGHVTVKGNEISGCSAVYGGGIYTCNGDVSIVGNVIHDNSICLATSHGYGAGIFLGLGTVARVASNTLYLNSVPSNITLCGGAISCHSGITASIVNNTIADNGSSTLCLGGGMFIDASGSATLTFQDNILASNLGGAVYATATSAAVLGYNCINGTVTNVTTTSTDILNTDPLFVDAASDDYHLTVNSPCLDAGDDSLVQSGDLDIDGQSRLFGSHVDIGADEAYYTSQPTFSPAEGVYGPTSVAVTISCADEGSSIYYTTDGSDPSAYGISYSNPVTITSTSTLKAIGRRSGYLDSRTLSGTYTIDGIAPTPGSVDVAETTSTAPIAVTYTGAYDNVGGSGLKHVELWYRQNQDSWVNSGLTCTGASGSFQFLPSITAADYYFGLVAEDNVGNRSAVPSGVGDCHTSFTCTGISGRPYIKYTYAYGGCPAKQTTLYDSTGTQIRQVSMNYGHEGELLSVSGDTEPVTFTYDGLYRLKTLADGRGNTHTYNYDDVGNLISEVYPGSNGQAFYSYDAAGNLTQCIDAKGVVSNYTRDSVTELVTAIQFPNYSAYNSTFAYDSYGRVTGMTDATGSKSYTYDDLDSLLSETTTYTGLPSRTVTYTCGSDGSLLSMGTPAGAFSFAYDDLGRPSSMSNPYGESAVWSYGNDNSLTSQTLKASNGSTIVTSSYTYDGRGRLATLSNALSDGTALSTFGGAGGAINYDGASNYGSIVSTVPASQTLTGTTSYTYDTRDQLMSELSTRNGGYSLGFGYDDSGNITSLRGQTRTYNALNQDSTFTFDLAGNPTSYRGTAASYDPMDHLASFGSLFTAGYGIGGERAWKEYNSNRTYYLYAGGVPVCEMDSTGTVNATNSFGVNGLVSRHGASGSTFYTFDPQGNVVQHLNSSGSVVAWALYDSYGSRLAGSSPSPFGYGAQSGYYTDTETGLVFLTNRYYDPLRGRFLTRDPIGYAGGANLYAYCGNNPVNRSDPSGLSPNDDDPFDSLDGWRNVTGARGFIRGIGAAFNESGNDAWNRDLHQISADDLACKRALGVQLAEYVWDRSMDVLAVIDGIGIVGKLADIERLTELLNLMRCFLKEGCFVSGTQVATPEGPVPIEGIRMGDVVYSSASTTSNQ